MSRKKKRQPWQCLKCGLPFDREAAAAAREHAAAALRQGIRITIS